MAQDRVVFLPWNETQAGDFRTETAHADRDTTHHKRKWSAVYLDSAGKPLAKLGFGTGVRVHIAGHREIGDPEIAADHGTGGSDRSYTEVVDLLIEKGLRKYFLGTVVCAVCYSAMGTPTNPPFVQLLARELWSRGFKGTCVLGYKGSLYATYCVPSKKYMHRVVKTDGGELGKSSDMQQRFFGWK